MNNENTYNFSSYIFTIIIATYKPIDNIKRFYNSSTLTDYTNCIFKCAESAFKYLHRLMPIHYQSALDIKRILISNRYY
jgi:hypothetical protein